MSFILTDHAKQRMIERDITLEEVKEVLELPDYTVDKGDKIEANKIINNRNLKIIYEPKGKFIKIITVINK